MKIKLPNLMPFAFSGISAQPFQRTALRSFILCAGLFGMQGCASVDAGTPNNGMSLAKGEQALQASSASAEEESVAAQVEPIRNFISDKRLSAEQMFMLLQAEMRLKRGLTGQAYQIYYQLAEETQDPEVARHTFNVAMATFNAENINKAVELWRQLDPKADDAWRASFVLSLRGGDLQKALGEWQNYADLTPADINQDILVAAKRASSGMIGDLTVAQQFLGLIVERYPQQWASYFGQGMIAAVQKDYPLALEALKKSLSFDDFAEKGQVYTLLAKIYLQMGQYEEGIAQLRSYAEKNPQDVELQERLARLEVQAGMNSDAQARYQKIVDENPQQYSAKFALALLQLENKEFESAKNTFTELLAIPAYKEIGNYYLGYALQEEGRNEEALEYFAKVTSPIYKTDALLHQAEIYFSQDDKDKAYQSLEQVDVSKQADQIKMLLAKAIFLRLEDKYSESADVLQQVLEIQPDHQRALLEQANIFYALERFADYEANMQQLLHLDENNVDALNGLGYYYAEQGINLPQAQLLIERAMQIEPENFFILDSMGWVLFQQKQYTEAVPYLEKAYAVKQDEVVGEHLIRAYWMAGMKAKAQALWDEFSERFKKNQEFTNLQGWIQQGSQ